MRKSDYDDIADLIEMFKNENIEPIILPKADFDRLVKSLDEPAKEPSEDVKKAVELYKNSVSRRC